MSDNEILQSILQDLVNMGVAEDCEIDGSDAVAYLNRLKEDLVEHLGDTAEIDPPDRVMPVCPDCGDVLTDRAGLSYCDACDNEVLIPDHAVENL